MVQPILRFKAHEGPVYALEKIKTGAPCNWLMESLIAELLWLADILSSVDNKQHSLAMYLMCPVVSQINLVLHKEASAQ